MVHCGGAQSGEVSKKEFIRFCRAHPALLFPAFQLQQDLQKKVGGTTFWLRLAMQRKRDFNDVDIDIDWLRKVVTRNGFVQLAQSGADLSDIEG